MDCSMPGFPVHHQHPESTQTYVHRVDDAIQPSHPLSSPSPPIFNLSQHQGLFKWVSSSHQVAKVIGVWASAWILPRNKCLLNSWLQSPSAVILEPKQKKSDTVSTVSPSISHEVMGPDAMILVFWMLSFKPTFSPSSFTFIKKIFSVSSFSTIRVVSSAYRGYLYFSQ